MDDFGVFLERTRHLFPRHKFRHLLGQLPELFKVDVPVGQPVGASFVQEVEILDEQREEGHDDPLALVFGSGRPPHGRLQRGTVAAEVGRRVHLVFQDGELGRLHLVPLHPAKPVSNLRLKESANWSAVYRLLQSGHGRHVQSGDDGHQRVEVADVEALAGHFDPVLDHLDALLLLHILWSAKRQKTVSSGTRRFIGESTES